MDKIDKNEFLREQLDLLKRKQTDDTVEWQDVKKQLFVCKSITLANFLISNGSNVLKIDKDNKNNNYLVFLFAKNKLLDTNLQKWRNK